MDPLSRQPRSFVESSFRRTRLAHANDGLRESFRGGAEGGGAGSKSSSGSRRGAAAEPPHLCFYIRRPPRSRALPGLFRGSSAGADSPILKLHQRAMAHRLEPQSSPPQACDRENRSHRDHSSGFGTQQNGRQRKDCNQTQDERFRGGDVRSREPGAGRARQQRGPVLLDDSPRGVARSRNCSIRMGPMPGTASRSSTDRNSPCSALSSRIFSGEPPEPSGWAVLCTQNFLPHASLDAGNHENDHTVSATPSPTPRLFTTREVAEILSVSPETVLRRVRAGKLRLSASASNAIRIRESRNSRRSSSARRRSKSSSLTSPDGSRQAPAGSERAARIRSAHGAADAFRDHRQTAQTSCTPPLSRRRGLEHPRGVRRSRESPRLLGILDLLERLAEAGQRLGHSTTLLRFLRLVSLLVVPASRLVCSGLMKTERV